MIPQLTTDVDAARLSVVGSPQQFAGGALIINADDWGLDYKTTDRIARCVGRGHVSSVSAMVFMEDSERSADCAQVLGIDAGLHLNLDATFTAPECSPRVLECQRRVAAYLHSHPFARALYHPRLSECVDYLVAAQVDEFARLYKHAPDRVDGHHHMHLCANVMFRRKLPAGIIVRRHFSFESGEKAMRNALFRLYARLMVDRRFRSTDFLFSLLPANPARLRHIFSLAREFVVEVETHPADDFEFEFLMGDQIEHYLNGVTVAHRFVCHPGPQDAGSHA